MSNIKIEGIISLAETTFIGFEKHQSMGEKFSNVINENYKKLEDLVKSENLTLKQENFEKSTFCFYYSVNSTDPYMSAFINAVEVDPSSISAEKIGSIGLHIGILPAQKKLLKVIYTGSYETLGEAWMQADTFVKENDWVRNSGSLPFERYVKQDGKNSITEIYIPIF